MKITHLLILLLLGTLVYFNFDEVQHLIDQYRGTEQQEQPTTASEEATTNRYFDTDKAFAKDSLFAIMSKEMIPAAQYDKTFEKTTLGGQARGVYPPVYVLRCMGKETRESYIFIVGQKFYDGTYIYQKLQKHEVATFEKYLSEERFKEDLFHNRFRFRMLD